MNNARLYIPFAALFLLEMALSFHFQSRLTRYEDIAYHLNGAQRILHGQELYKDVIVPNLPMFFYMRIPGVWLAEWLNLRPIRVAVVFDNLMALLSLALSLRIMAKTTFNRPAPMLTLAAVLAGALFILPYYDNVMGQQEYFFWLCTLPYFLLAAARAQGAADYGRIFCLLIGALAAIGFCYKPVFIFPLLLVETYLAWRRGMNEWSRPETALCITLGTAYIVWVLLMPGFQLVFLPTVDLYYGWHESPEKIAQYFSKKLLPFALPVLGLWLWALWRKTSTRHFQAVLLLAFIGYALTDIAQLKIRFFGYHHYPAYAMGFVCIAFLIFAESSASVRRFATAAALCVLVAYTSQMVMKSSRHDLYRQAQRVLFLERLAKLTKETPDPWGGVYVMGLSLSPVFPEGIFYRPQTFQWNYRFYDQWLYEGIAHYRKEHEDQTEKQLSGLRAIGEWLRAGIAEDVIKNKPSMMIVTKRSYLHYFSLNPDFKKFMEGYRLKERTRNGDIYLRN